MYVQMRGFLAREGMLELGGAPPEAPAAVIHSGPLYLDLRQHIVQTVASDEEEARQLIRPHIVRLRRKLEPDPQQPRFLISVRGIGYCWVS